MGRHDNPRAQPDDRSNMGRDMRDEERLRDGAGDDVRGIADEGDDEFEETDELDEEEEDDDRAR